MTPEQQDQACDALVKLGALETQQGLHAEGVQAIQTALACSQDDARAVLRDLRLNKVIEETSTPGEVVDDRTRMPALRFQWVRPPERQ